MVIKPDDKRVEFLAMRKSGGLTSKRKCLSTGFQNMDEHAKLAKGYLSIWSGYPGSGKALALDTPILTMHGWKTIGSIVVGDMVFDDKGKLCRIIRATDVMHDHECFAMEFSDGGRIVADADHRWFVETKGREIITTTKEIHKNINSLFRPGYLIRSYFDKRFCDFFLDGKKRTTRKITKCSPCESVPVRCIEVNSPTHLYLAGKTLVPTHNTEFLDAVLMNMSLLHGWKTLYYSPENHPIEEHMTKLAEKFIGKHISEFKEAEELSSLDFLQKHFTWMYPEDPKLDTLLGLATKEHEQNGIDALVIDPWNAVTHHRGGELIHEYLSEALSKMIRFGRGNNVFIAIVAHPTKPQKDKDGNFPVPTLYDISDGAMWRNKADYGFICHRADMSKNELDVYIQKVKYKWMGKVGMTRFDYNYRNGRFKQPEDKDFWLPTEVVPPF